MWGAWTGVLRAGHRSARASLNGSLWSRYRECNPTQSSSSHRSLATFGTTCTLNKSSVSNVGGGITGRRQAWMGGLLHGGGCCRAPARPCSSWNLEKDDTIRRARERWAEEEARTPKTVAGRHYARYLGFGERIPDAKLVGQDCMHWIEDLLCGLRWGHADGQAPWKEDPRELAASIAQIFDMAMSTRMREVVDDKTLTAQIFPTSAQQAMNLISDFLNSQEDDAYLQTRIASMWMRTGRRTIPMIFAIMALEGGPGKFLDTLAESPAWSRWGLPKGALTDILELVSIQLVHDFHKWIDPYTVPPTEPRPIPTLGGEFREEQTPGMTPIHYWLDSIDHGFGFRFTPAFLKSLQIVHIGALQHRFSTTKGTYREFLDGKLRRYLHECGATDAEVEKIFAAIDTATQDYQINPKCHAPVEWDSSGNDVSVADLEAFESAMTFDGCASWVIDRVTMPFPSPSGVYVNMMPIYLFGDLEDKLPPELHGYIPIIKNCVRLTQLDMEDPKQDWDDFVAFLTVDERVAEPGVSQRRSGLHTESPGALLRVGDTTDFRTDSVFHRWGVGHRTGGAFVGGIFMASTAPDTTAVYGARLKRPGVDVGADATVIQGLGDCEHLRGVVQHTCRTLEANQLVWMTDLTLHESLPVPEGVQRQYFRLVVGKIDAWYEAHSTANPLCPLPSDIKVVVGSKFEPQP